MERDFEKMIAGGSSIKKELTFFGKVFDPLKIKPVDEDEMRSMLRAVNEISALEGDTRKIEEKLQK